MSQLIGITVVSSLLGIVLAFLLRQWQYKRAYEKKMKARRAAFEASLKQRYAINAETESFIKANNG